jgi:hypothetical protein
VKLRNIYKLSFGDFVILGEAIALAGPVEIGLRCLSVESLVARLGRTRGHRDKSRPLDVHRVAYLIERAASLYPFRATCLKKSLVLLRILRRRGIPAELRLGVRKVQDELNAHAWIDCEGHTLIGGGVEHLYAMLPPAPAFRHSGARPRASGASSQDIGHEDVDVLR